MAIDAKSLGYEASPIEFSYTWRDTVMYALGVGASADTELDYLYEGRGPKVLPTFCTIPTFAAFDALVDRIGCDRQGMVHHSQQMDLFKPLRPNARLRVMGKVVGLYDLKRLAMSVFSIDAFDEDGDLIIRGEVTLALRNDGGFGGERPPKTARVHPPDREPDFEVRNRVGPTQALLYRLSGDYNPLHADPDFAARIGLTRRFCMDCAPMGSPVGRSWRKRVAAIRTSSRRFEDSSATPFFRETRSSSAAGTKGSAGFSASPRSRGPRNRA